MTEMHSRRRSRCLAGVSSLLILLASEPILAQRQLSWNALDVTARLGDDGVLDVTELQTMIFTGDWNGGERTFNLRPRQDLDFVGMERIGPAAQSVPLILDGSLDDVDDYAFTDGRTLRWRSRLPLDPPFSGTRITYALHYRLSGILLKEDERYVLDHDFAFPDRAGSITSFSLRLTLDGGWQPLSELRDRYTAGPLAPGRGFVLTIPLRFTGSGSPTATDTRRPREIVAATAAILGTFVLLAAGLLIREYSLGRFKPVQSHGVDAGWIRAHIVAHPAELIGAAWDQDVDKDEVGAVIARLVSEAKLAGSVSPGSAGTSLSLELKVDRSSLQGYERTLVDGLFFDGRTRTSTDEIKKHYENQGFDPAKTIAPELNERVKDFLPKGNNPSVWWWPSLLLFLIGVGCLVEEGISAGDLDSSLFVVGSIALVVAGIGRIPGVVVRQRIDWGIKAFLLSMLWPLLVAVSAAAFLWYWVGSGTVEWTVWMIGAVTALTLWAVQTALNALKSRNHREAIAFRKMLAAGREYFQRELAKQRPALSDEWYPWVAAFGLTNEAARWTVRHASNDDSTPSWPTSSGHSSFSSGSSATGPVWTGAAGGQSGGAGGGATWSSAVAGMAAGVSAPSSSGDGGSSGGSSGGGSSGGGGGGGW